MLRILANTFKYALKTRQAWFFTASARTKARFARTFLGNYWLGLSNVLFILSLGLIYGVVFQVENFKDYFIYLGLGFSTWTALGNSINSAPEIFVQNTANISNTTLDPLYYVLEEWIFQIQTFAQTFAIIIIFLGILDFNIFLNFILYSPLHLLNIAIFMFWAPLIICILGIRFCDLFQLVPLFLQLNFLLSPILYEEKSIGKISFYMNFNPLYKILGTFRDSIINGEFLISKFIIIFLFNIIMFLISLSLFNSKKKKIIFYL